MGRFHVLVLTALMACGGEEASRFDSGIPNGGDGGQPLDDSPFTNDTIVSLFFDPPMATVLVDNGVAQSASFTLRAKLANGNAIDVTPMALQFDRPDIAKMTTSQPVVLTASGEYAGTGTLHGIYNGLEAIATLEVDVHVSKLEMGVDPKIAKALDGASMQDPSLGALLYPYDKTIFPLGITSPLTMWNAPNANDTYRVHVEEKGYTYDLYSIVALPAQKRVEQDAWDRITASNQGDAVKVTLSRYDAKTMSAWISATQSYGVARASLRGAIYYWTTSAGGHMSRIRPGTGAQPEVLNGGKCMGCHAVSADGTTLVAAVEGGGPTSGSPPGPNQAQDKQDGRPWVSFDLPGTTVRKLSTAFAGNVAVNPDGKYTVFGDQKLYLADTATGQIFTNTGLDDVALDPNMKGLMTPAFSPDGKRFVAVEGAGSWYHNLTNGKLVTLDFDQTTRAFTNLKSLASASLFPQNERAIAYPSFTPDGQWVAFHVGDYTTGCDVQGCDDNAKQVGAIWLQNVSGAKPVRLDQLTDSSANLADHDLSLEPTFNPAERGGYFWVVFTSPRNWGNRITGVANNGKKRLWVAAIDKQGGVTDSSHPAFFLEGQEENTTNMRGFWALAACIPTMGGGACKAGFECCSGFCDMGKCIDIGQLSCKGLGGACVVDEDCCNAPVARCVAGKCAAKVQ